MKCSISPDNRVNCKLYAKSSMSGIGNLRPHSKRIISASILCRSVHFRVSEKGAIKLCQQGEWLCLQVRSAGKVFRSYPKLLKVLLKRLHKFRLFVRFSERTLVDIIYSQPDCADNWQLESKQLDANQLTAASCAVSATSWAAKPLNTS